MSGVATKKHRNGTIIVDDADAVFLSYCTAITKGTYSTHVAVYIEGKRKRLSRVIAGASDGFVVDHINGNPLDNRRDNLRVCTSRQNNWNRRRRKGGQSHFKGVVKRPNGWEAAIYPRGRRRRLGIFETEIDAAKAYDAAAREEYGDFSCLNFPTGGEQSAQRPDYHGA